MYGCTVRQEGPARHYQQRLEMAADLIETSGQSDWAIGIGLVRNREDAAVIVEKYGPQNKSEYRRVFDNV